MKKIMTAVAAVIVNCNVVNADWFSSMQNIHNTVSGGARDAVAQQEQAFRQEQAYRLQQNAWAAQQRELAESARIAAAIAEGAKAALLAEVQRQQQQDGVLVIQQLSTNLPPGDYGTLAKELGADKVVDLIKWLLGEAPDTYTAYDLALGITALPVIPGAKYGVTKVLQRDELVTFLKMARGKGVDIIVRTQKEAEELLRDVWPRMNFNSITYGTYSWPKGSQGVAQIHPPEVAAGDHLALPHYKFIANQPKLEGQANPQVAIGHIYFESVTTPIESAPSILQSAPAPVLPMQVANLALRSDLSKSRGSTNTSLLSDNKLGISFAKIRCGAVLGFWQFDFDRPRNISGIGVWLANNPAWISEYKIFAKDNNNPMYFLVDYVVGASVYNYSEVCETNIVSVRIFGVNCSANGYLWSKEVQIFGR